MLSGGAANGNGASFFHHRASAGAAKPPSSWELMAAGLQRDRMSRDDGNRAS
ncbi:hypothetical protein RTCIAT899_PB00030 (plasmid) [Rhizobium tropici CIAT 899]|nr:hypothetical protein RTCIAT899_PB00030 [Rhizobium tropici CIAT 899]